MVEKATFGSNCVLTMITPKVKNKTSRSLYMFQQMGVLGLRGHALQSFSFFFFNLELKINKLGDFRWHLYKDKGQNLVVYTLLPNVNTNANVQIPLTSCDIIQCEH